MLRQPYHLVEYSPWPLTSSMAALSLTSALISWFHLYSTIPLALSIMLTLITMYQWWRDVTRESTFMGHHTSTVTKGLRLGMILFIASEVAFFFSFFWAFFHSSLAPVPSLGSLWPPTGISPIDPFSVPLLNTAVLLASGMTVTWAHHSILSLSEKDTSKSLMLTISLGAYFTFLQMEEYAQSPFSIADSIYGTTFFVATGFHGLHVIIGSSFLTICLLRNSKLHNSQLHHFGFEAAAWYWHFVDVVWIFLFICIYWWGS